MRMALIGAKQVSGFDLEKHQQLKHGNFINAAQNEPSEATEAQPSEQVIEDDEEKIKDGQEVASAAEPVDDDAEEGKTAMEIADDDEDEAELA